MFQYSPETRLRMGFKLHERRVAFKTDSILFVIEIGLTAFNDFPLGS